MDKLHVKELELFVRRANDTCEVLRTPYKQTSIHHPA